MKVLVFGSSGLLGHSLIEELKKSFEVVGTTRKISDKDKTSYYFVEDILCMHLLEQCISDVGPDIAINCISLRDINSANLDQLRHVFSDFPKNLSDLSLKYNFRLVQISSDAVFSGKKGNYIEQDIPDPIDNYGLAKLEGESLNENSLIIRTSMIGHSINGESGLLDWFIKQKKCTLYKNAIFSGLPVNEISRIISQYFITDKNLTGIFHISSNPISKYELLSIVKEKYELNIKIASDEDYKIDRSLNSSKFQKFTGYRIKSWNDMISTMREENMND